MQEEKRWKMETCICKGSNPTLTMEDNIQSCPYVEIDMRSGELEGYDAIFLTPHKFLGGRVFGNKSFFYLVSFLFKVMKLQPLLRMDFHDCLVVVLVLFLLLIIALVARDAVVAIGGPSWSVPTGRRNGLISNSTEAANNIPIPTSNFIERQTSREGISTECAFRISSEGLTLLLPYITKQILSASLVDFKHLLQYRTIKFADFVDAEFGEKASMLKLGCFIVVLRKEGDSTSDLFRVDASTIAIGCWKGKSNVFVMVSAIDSQELLQRLSVQSGDERGSLAQESKPPSLEMDKKGPTDDLDVNLEPGTIGQAPVG
ncbi:hypothetical protein NE237_027047 [Protea cynaroides]|uniref:Plant heme peroxidase family profile domain-containing protein n=1 Tax=Protea cynaroides TaxID=273540 RepID=A0A9Q0GPR1_9MAGN|nr:hypothetical protein NE237_027047 [Protea cynaroides]